MKTIGLLMIVIFISFFSCKKNEDVNPSEPTKVNNVPCLGRKDIVGIKLLNYKLNNTDVVYKNSYYTFTTDSLFCSENVNHAKARYNVIYDSVHVTFPGNPEQVYAIKVINCNEFTLTDVYNNIIYLRK